MTKCLGIQHISHSLEIRNFIMDDLSDYPIYTPDTTREKLEKKLINIWPGIYRFVNSLLYLILRTTKDIVKGAMQQMFKW